MVFQFKNKVETKEEVNNLPAKMLLEPKEVEINGCKFLISKMPCMTAQEVAVKLPTGLLPLINQFSQSEEMVIKMLACCQRIYKDKPNVPLISKEIINNHVPDFDTLIKLEHECVQYNYDFFENGKLLNFLNKGVCLAESKVSGILTDLLDKLLQVQKQH